MTAAAAAPAADTPVRTGERLALALAVLLAVLCLAGSLCGPIGRHAGRFVLLYAATWATAFALFTAVPAHWSRQRQVRWILLLAAACRLALIPHPVSDDVHRYLWEGRVTLHGMNPYVLAPDAAALTPLRDSTVWPGINHPDQTACYPPLMTLLFAGLAGIHAGFLPLKLTFILGDLVAVWCLLQLLNRRGLAPRWALLYAANPLILYAFAGQAHLDAVHLALLAGALLLYEKRHWPAMFLCLGLAIQAKYVAVLALPFLLRRDNLRYAWVTAATAMLPFFFFLEADAWATFQSLTNFGGHLAFGGSLHYLFRALFGAIEPATAVCTVLFVLTYGTVLVRMHPERGGAARPDPTPGLVAVFGALLLLSPTVHYWYVSWVLILVTLRPLWSWTVLSLTSGLYFLAVGLQYYSGTWGLPAWSLVVMWCPVWMLAALELRRHRRRGGRRWPAPDTVAVIIPTRNEQDRIAACIEAVRSSNAATEILVVDADSEDETVVRARAAGARVLPHAAPAAGGGRGSQILAGARATQADVVVIVHADTCIAPELLPRIRQLLRLNPDVIGGAGGGRFDAPDWPLRLIEAANDVRAGFFGISFGDQVQFFRRPPALDAELVPDLPLMEDVELSLRLQRHGRTAFLWTANRVSARQWQRGRAARAGLILRLFAGYLLRRLRGPVDTRAMYRRYYGS